MIRFGFLFTLLGMLPLVPAAAERLPINEKKAPGGRNDLEAIQALLKSALPEARKATICIELDQGSGSGVVVSEDGLILTAAHVTGGVDREFTVVFEDGRRVPAVSLGLSSESDCAMAKITEKGSYPYVDLERSDQTRLGDWVFSLGHSGGFDEARGSVVRLGRLIRIVNDSTWQSDCNLIGGDSGGPLFDLRGRLIGIHSRVGSKLPENMHVPIKEFLRHWEALERGNFIGDGPFAEKPQIGKGFLGLLAEAHEGEGIVVKRVGRESPAEKAGIREGDVLLTLNTEVLSRREDLKELLASMAPGAKVAFEMLRDGKPESVSLKLGNRDD
ncbi:MAG: S1C family serine protease [Verrucomicrobiales bacterium]